MIGDYVIKAATAWFIGFFPLAEIYVAIPAAVATGLDDVSVVFWSVFGNLTPVFLINYLYEWMIRFPRIGRWLTGLVSEKAKARINRWGIGFVLLLTPWTGVWVMAVTAKALGMSSRRFIPAASVSVLVYAIVIVVLLRAGITALA